MKTLSTLCALLLGVLGLSAQNWTVGTPVNLQLSELTVFGGSCDPIARASLNFLGNPVDGVTYYYKVIAVQSNGDWSMVPGPAGPLAMNDTVHIVQTTTQLFNSGSTGQIQLQVWAEGMPTTPGQAHPCQPQNLWFSNLLICNEGLTCNIANSCSTQLSTGIMEEMLSLDYQAPLPENGFVLLVREPGATSVTLTDGRGALVYQGVQGRVSIDLSDRPDGIYLLTVERNGVPSTGRFVLAR